MWEFTADRFQLTLTGEASPELVEAFLAPGETAGTIVGAWRLDADGSTLVFSEIEKKRESAVNDPAAGGDT